MKSIQYTIRGVETGVDGALRRLAAREGNSLNCQVLETLKKGLGMQTEDVRHGDLDDLAGKWVHDPEFDKAIEDMDKVDEELWK
jgi:plasmid stability protein